jgi:antitoxin (DNA-binding transcriptional repressor) of toxin-antitoxin stability system
MDQIINTKALRASLPRIVNDVRHGARYTVLYRSRPAFRIVPVEEKEATIPLEDDPLYRADAVGETVDGFTAADHDRLLYGGGVE